jgi:mevalonate kinase
MAFAPGKVLLFGEHSVVYGHPAIATAIGVGVTALAQSGAPRLRCADWKVEAAPGDGTRVGRALEALVDALPFGGGALELSASVPPGAGLGSSAAMAVACARALAELHDAPLSEVDLAAAALASERVFHGTPSGLDHAAVIHGGLVRFQRTESGAAIRSIARTAPLELVIARVEQGADTGRMVAEVAEQRRRLGDVAVGLHERIAAVTDAADAALVAGDDATVGELMTINHALLAAIGVSTPGLDRACALARSSGALGAKLTGAGGGGSIVAIAPGARREVAAALTALGCEVVEGGEAS